MTNLPRVPNPREVSLCPCPVNPRAVEWIKRCTVHELAVTQSVLDMAVEKAQEAGAARVTRLSLVVGALTGVVEDCVRFYFDLIAQDTIAQGASIAFRSVPAQVRCRQCEAVYCPNDTLWACPQCGSAGAEIIAGRELFLESIEVDGDTRTTEHPGG